MATKEQLKKTVKHPSDISQEQLMKELKGVARRTDKERTEVAKEILQEQKEEEMRRLLTNPSAVALTTTKHEAGIGIDRIKKTVRQLFILYLTNQFVARAINIRADTLITKGYKIIGEDPKGVEACQGLIDNSGGTNLFWQTSVNTDIAGDGFLEKVYNLTKNKILKLKHVHPLTLSFKRDKTTNTIILNDEKEPLGYVQFYLDEQGVEAEKDVPKDRISHLRFNTLGDEFTGISTIQPGYNTIVRLMNMEYSAAEAAIKTANPLTVVTANTKSPHQIALWGQILGRINGREQVFIPQDMDMKFLSPGNQNFSEYADYFLNAVVATFGVPKGVLLGGSGDRGSGNRAEGIILSRHFYSVVRSNQKYMEEFFNTIFEEYAELAGFKSPQLVFEDVAEDATLAAESTIDLYSSGLITREEARQMIGLEQEPVGNKHTFVQGISSDIKQDQKNNQFPEEPGKATGKQAGIKKKQKASPFSAVKPSKR